MTRWAEGGNYRFDLERGLVTCKVWARPDVDRETGARFAEEKAAIFEELLALSRGVAKLCLFDVRDAPTTWGPATHAALERCVELWERAQRRIAIVVSNDPLQVLLIRELVKTRAPRYGSVFTDMDAAIDSLLGDGA